LDEYGEANLWAKRALEAGEKSENVTAVAAALQIMGCTLADAGRIDEALPLLEKSLQVAVEHNAFNEAGVNLINLTFYTSQRDLSRARVFATRLLDSSIRENYLFGQATSLGMLSILDWLGGNWLMAMDETTKAFEMQERLGFKFSVFNAEAWRGLLHLGMGDLEQAEEYLQLALAKQDPAIASRVEANLGLGILRLEQGREEEAKAHFDAGVDAFKPAEFSTSPLLNVETLLHLTGIYARRGQLDEARRMSEWARRLADTLKSDAGLAMASQAEANLLYATGDLNGAQKAYLESLSFWEKAGWPYYYAKAMVEHTEAMAKASPQESRNRLEEAIEIFKKLGAKRDLEKAKAKLSAHT
jgi:tetratricopeptide (TPR) repeat protein